MLIFRTKKELSIFLEKEANKTIGFVPTMGALHEGHLSLIRKAKETYDICVASIFVNPTQFNNQKDLETYPRDEKQDIYLLEKEGCDCLFLPSVEEIYGKEFPPKEKYNFGLIGEVMEGEKRPGHFDGVAQVVKRLFLLVNPTGAFFGEKDYQQIAIILAMIKQEGLSLNIHPVPIIRELSGLAMSSRNQRLTEETKKSAPMIFKTLQESLTMDKKHFTPIDISQWVTEKLNSIPHLNVEYYTLVNAETMETISSWDDCAKIIGCIACYCGEVRLIDNIHY